MIKPKTTAKSAVKRANRTNKGNYLAKKGEYLTKKGQYLKDKGEYKARKANAAAKTKRAKMYAGTAATLGAEATAALSKQEEERTKRAAFEVDKLKSWASLVGGNPSPEAGQSGATQNGSTTEMDATLRKIRESVNYG